MKKNIYLVRHAQYDNPLNILVGRLPVNLSKDGLKEAKKLQKYFEEKNISKIYSSEVQRCKQTSEIISNKKIPINFDQRLLETFSAFQGFWEMDWTHFFKYTDSLGGEIPKDIYDRVSNFWEDVVNVDNDEKDIVICSHGDPLYLLYVYCANKDIPDTMQIYEILIDEYQPKASIRKVVINDDGAVIKPILSVSEI